PVFITPSNPSIPSGPVDAPTIGFEMPKRSSKADLAPRLAETTGHAAAAELSKRRLLTRRRIGLSAALLAISSLAILLGGRFLARPGPPPALPPPPLVVPAPAVLAIDLGSPRDLQAVAVAPAVRSILWTIDSVPSGADVVRAEDNEVLGQTPWRFAGPAKEGS